MASSSSERHDVGEGGPQFGVVTTNFASTDGETLLASAASCLPDVSFADITVGDKVIVFGSKDGWAYGEIVETDELGQGTSQRRRGLFPVDYVLLSECSGHDNSGDSDSAEALASDISCLLDGWWTALKKAHATCSNPRNTTLINEYMDELIEVRDRLTALSALPVDELKRERAEFLEKAARGNLWLDLELSLPRRAEPSTAEMCETRLYRELRTRADELAQCPSTRTLSGSPTTSTTTRPRFLMLNVVAANLFARHDCELIFELFDAEKRAFVSESITCHWLANTRALAASGNAIFELHPELSTRRRLLLLIRVVRNAPLDAGSSSSSSSSGGGGGSGSATLKRAADLCPASQWCRQPYAHEIIDLTPYVDAENGSPTTESGGTPATEVKLLSTNAAQLDESFEQTLLKACDNKPGVKRKAAHESTPWVTIRLTPLDETSLGATNAQRLQSLDALKFPSILSDSVCGETNAIYVSLISGEFAGKAGERNAELRLQLVDSCGKPATTAHFEVRTAGGRMQQREWRGLVMPSDERPTWSEMVKVVLDEDLDRDVHLRICLYARRPYDKSKPDKGPIGLAFLPLTSSRRLLEDDTHDLAVYKMDAAHFPDSNVSYLSLQSKRHHTQQHASSTKSASPSSSTSIASTIFSPWEKCALRVRTRIASSTLSSNADIVDLLRWTKRGGSSVLHALVALAQPNPAERTRHDALKLHAQLLDKLFEMFDERTEWRGQLFETLVNLLHLIRLVEQQGGRILAAYLETFSYLRTWSHLWTTVHDALLLADASRPSRTEDDQLALAAVDELPSVFRIALASKAIAERLSDVVVNGFEDETNNLLSGLCRLAVDPSPQRTSLKLALLKVVPKLLDPLIEDGTVDLRQSIGLLVDGLVTSPHAVVDQLHVLVDLIDSTLLVEPETRQRFLHGCLEAVLAPLERGYFELLPETVAACSEVLSRLVELLWENNSRFRSVSDEERDLLVERSCPAVVRTMNALDRYACPPELKARWWSLTLALLHRQSAEAFGALLGVGDETPGGDLAFSQRVWLNDLLLLFRKILQVSPIASAWRPLVEAQTRVLLRQLEFLKSAVQSNYHEIGGEGVQLWEIYVLTAVDFLTQPALQPVYVPPNVEREEAKAKARRTAARDIKSVWFYLQFAEKRVYIPSMIRPLLRAAMVDDEVVRGLLLPIFYDMMACEFAVDKNFEKVSAELLAQIDELVNSGHGDAAFRVALTDALTDECRSNMELWSAGGRTFVDDLGKLFDLLLDWRDGQRAQQSVGEWPLHTLLLIARHYGRRGQSKSLLAYVLKLHAAHASRAHNEMEAAHALLMQVDQLETDGADSHTGAATRSSLLEEAAEKFAVGQLWEDAIAALKRQAELHEKVIVDYIKLAAIHARMSQLYESIEREQRLDIEYYLVAFHGRGFPPSLQRKRLVFRSEPLEQLATFSQRLSVEYAAQLISNCELDDETNAALHASPGRFLQIMRVEPVERSMPFGEDSTAISPAVRAFYRNYHINTFLYSRPVEEKSTKWTKLAPTNDALRLWLSRRRLESEMSLPNVLRFTKVVSLSDPYLISPLEYALEVMQKKNADLMEAAIRAVRSPSLSSSTSMVLSRDIIGVVQANVQGGVKNYEVFLTEACQSICTVEEMALIEKLRDEIIKQVSVLEYCIYVHKSRRGADPSIHHLLVTSFTEHKRYVAEKFGFATSILPVGETLGWSNSTNDDISQQQQQSLTQQKRSVGALHQLSAESITPLAATGVGGGTLSKVFSKVAPARRSSQLKPEGEDAVSMSRFGLSTPSAADDVTAVLESWKDLSLSRSPRTPRTMNFESSSHYSPLTPTGASPRALQMRWRSATRTSDGRPLSPPIASATPPPPLPTRTSTLHADPLPASSTGTLPRSRKPSTGPLTVAAANLGLPNPSNGSAISPSPTKVSEV